MRDKKKKKLTLPLSSNFVNMTIMDDICSQIMRQKSSNVSISGPTVEGQWMTNISKLNWDCIRSSRIACEQAYLFLWVTRASSEEWSDPAGRSRLKTHFAALPLDFGHAAWPCALVLQCKLVRSLVLKQRALGPIRYYFVFRSIKIFFFLSYQSGSKTSDILNSRLLVLLSRPEKSKNGE